MGLHSLIALVWPDQTMHAQMKCRYASDPEQEHASPTFTYRRLTSLSLGSCLLLHCCMTLYS